MDKVISISLGSSKRNYNRIISFNQQKLNLIRLGTDGCKRKAAMLIRHYDGQVPFIGLGGVNLNYLWRDKKYPCHDGVS
ncbi:MAG: quinate 5-dehydrogenase, partial [Bacillota bacterium]|nr:quinate 5-dehydrogenase [Bacillota bacterium]